MNTIYRQKKTPGLGKVDKSQDLIVTFISIPIYLNTSQA